MATGNIGYGSTFGYETTIGGGTYTAFSYVVSINDPEIAVGKVDATHLGSTNQAKERLPGLIDAGDNSIEVIFDKTQFAAVYALILTTRSWKITYSQSSTLVFSGFICKIRVGECQAEKVISNVLDVCVTGKPTFVA